jgi:hypothetical protein
MPTRSKLRVPTAQVAAFEAIRDLPETDFGNLVAVFRAAQSGDVAALRRNVESAVPLLTGTAEAVIDMLISVTVLRNQRRETPQQTAVALEQAVGMPGDDAQREVIGSRLASLLATRALAVTGKAVDLLYSNERNFLRSRIVTEIRPIFGDDPSEAPEAAIFAHRLEIEFVDPAGHERTLQFALDQEDLADLKATVERADVKSVITREFIERSGLMVANPSGEPSES